MTKARESLEELFARVLRVPIAVIEDSTTPKSLLAWNSLRHIEIVVAVENNYGVVFSTAEILALQSVKGFRETLSKKGVTA